MMQADVGSGFLTAAFSLVQNQFLIMAGIKLQYFGKFLPKNLKFNNRVG